MTRSIRRRFRRRTLAPIGLLVVLLLSLAFDAPGQAEAASGGASGKWVHRVPMTATVHEHRFTRLEVRGAGCQAVYSVSFDAPGAGYATGNQSANYYRFQMRIKLDDGARITSRVFFNRLPGRRKYTAAFDTSAEGCWSKRPHRIQRVSVLGCRGKNCTVPAGE